MINNKNPRSYEVSIWTLQDSFITILKHTNLEPKGLIEEPKISLKDDSEDTFSFKIPMYIRRNGKKVENPIWYNTTNGNLIANLRKLKVIFNKGIPFKERIFEFLITKVTESHEGYQTYCEVESEGLAFNELGKTGYKINLSSDLYNIEYNEWIDNGSNGAMPINNINYWIDKVLPQNFSWSYRINMDWSDMTAFDDILDANKVYEDAYIENWTFNNNSLIPTNLVKVQEKLRLVEASDSNRYNLLQTIAETFGVYCRYVYEYDDNYHIINRYVEFYNHGLKETEGALDFTYYYDTEDISREMDSADQITKMIVVSNNSDADLIDNSITNIEANKSLEDYLLNFDYLLNIGAISQEQYDEVAIFESKMRQYNEQLTKISNEITVCEDKLIEARANLENTIIAVQEDNNRVEEERAYVKHLLKSDKTDYDGDPETLSITGLNPEISIIYKDGEILRCDVKKEGALDDGKFFAFTSFADAQAYYESNSSPQNNLILTKNQFEKVNGFITGLINLDTNASSLFLVYNYNLQLYHKQLAQEWETKKTKDEKNRDKYQAIVDNLHGKREGGYDGDLKNPLEPGIIQTLQEKYTTILEEKERAILNFEKMMGPALREGTWQPEDEYSKYGDKRILNDIDFFALNLNDNIIWDSNLFEDEDDNNYEYGIAQKHLYYPCINLTRYEGLFTPEALQEYKTEDESEDKIIYLSDIGFVWDDTIPLGVNALNGQGAGQSDFDINFPYSFNIGSEAQLCFIRYKGKENTTEQGTESSTENEEETQPVYEVNKIYPVLMLTNPDSYCNTYNVLNNPSLNNATDIFKSLNGGIGRIITTVKTNTEELGQTTEGTATISRIAKIGIPIEEQMWIPNEELSNFEMVYPRLKISSFNFKNNTDNYQLSTGSHILSPFSDYYVLSRYDGSNNNTDWADVKTNDNGNLIYENDGNEINTSFSYYITIKPTALFQYYTNSNYPNFKFNYEFSNTGLAIYLDAIKIMKENAWPKVTYTITPKIIKTDFMQTAYDSIHQLIHINDPELKFENVMGYISGIDLDLDKPWEDSIEVKNYKTKFEDLFTSIVASTAQMQKNSTVIDSLSTSLSTSGQMTVDSIQNTLLNSEMQLAYSQGNTGTFSINNNRISAINDNGAVVYSSAGIFTATEKDEETGNWIWNTSILPSGISANAITSGRIDTSLIRIYSGDDLRLQMNEDGLFAYKSWFSDTILPDDTTDIIKRDGLDPSQYVAHNADGLFLVAKKGATPEYQQIKYKDIKEDNNLEPLKITVGTKTYSLDRWPDIDEFGKFKYNTVRHSVLEQDVNRIEISWDGLKLRNWNNDVTFYADPDTGDLILGGTLIENSTYLTIPGNIMDSIRDANNPEDNSGGEEEVEEGSSTVPQTFEEYIINALQTNSEDIRYLRPDVAAIKMNKYMDIQSDYTGGVISNNLGLKYTPILKNLKTGIQNWNQNSLPNEPDEFEALYLLQDIIENGEITYNAGNTIWYTGNEWETLESNNINIGTGGSLNLLGANINLGANSELNLLSGGKFNAIAANEVLIASAENANNGVGDGTPDLGGSYIWMHDVNIGTEENPSYQKQLDIGTTGTISVNVDSLRIKTFTENDIEDYTVDDYIYNTPINKQINTWFDFNEDGLTISNKESTNLWKTVTGIDGYSVKYNDEIKFSVRQDKCQTNSIKIGDLVIKKSAKNGMVWVKE